MSPSRLAADGTSAMPGSRWIPVVLACIALVAGAGEIAPEPTPHTPMASSRPFFELRKHQTEYAGPGREAAEPADVREVRIGYFGPCDPAHPDGGDMWRGAQQAIEEANAAGGYRGKPFRLVPGWSQRPWQAGVVEVTRMVYSEQVWAIIGGIDGPSTHLAEQVVAKARLTLVSPGSTDKTVNLANVPWMFSVLPGDHLQAPVLAAAIAAHVGQSPLHFVSADDHDSHLWAEELSKALAGRGIGPHHSFQCKAGASDADLSALAQRIADAQPGAVVLVANAHDSARLLGALRQEGFAGAVFGGPAMGRRRFLEEAGPAAEGVVFPRLDDPAIASSPWASAFEDRFGAPPDYAAAAAYDAVRLVTAAIHKAGLNRARIRDAVKELSPWSGVSGTIQWDNLGANARPVLLATIRRGQIAPLIPHPCSAGLSAVGRRGRSR